MSAPFATDADLSSHQIGGHAPSHARAAQSSMQNILYGSATEEVVRRGAPPRGNPSDSAPFATSMEGSNDPGVDHHQTYLQQKRAAHVGASKVGYVDGAAQQAAQNNYAQVQQDAMAAKKRNMQGGNIFG